MAIYHCHVKTVSRSKGASAVAGAAYRAGAMIRDEKHNKTHDYSRKSDVGFSTLIGWSGSRSELWNCAELTDTRKNATTAREYEVAIPRELSPSDRIVLAREYAEWIYERHGVAVDLNIHDLKGDKPHAHILTTTRESHLTHLGEKVAREWSDKRRKEHGLKGRKEDLLEAREKWATLANQYLAESNRIDHRSYEAQGIDKVPQLKLGKSTFHQHKRTGKTNQRYERWLDSINGQIAANDPLDETMNFRPRWGMSGEEIAQNYKVEFQNIMFLDYSIQPSAKTYEVNQTSNKVRVVANDETLISKLKTAIKKAANNLRESIPQMMRARQIEQTKPQPKPQIKPKPKTTEPPKPVAKETSQPSRIEQQRQREYEHQLELEKRQQEAERKKQTEAEELAELERQRERQIDEIVAKAKLEKATKDRGRGR